MKKRKDRQYGGTMKWGMPLPGHGNVRKSTCPCASSVGVRQWDFTVTPSSRNSIMNIVKNTSLIARHDPEYTSQHSTAG
jgi:hypothetical protein